VWTPGKRASQSPINGRQVLGAALLTSAGAFSLWYLRRRVVVPIHETDAEVSTAQAMPQAIPAEAAFGDAPIQLLSSGAGPLYVRSYQVDIAHPQYDPEGLMKRIVEDPNTFTPQEMAHFDKTKGDPACMAVGDEYYIHIVGPWDGPVRVIDVKPTEFTFATLKGHLEAGEITFSAARHPTDDSLLRFAIRSWARSSNTITDVFYRVFGVLRFAQTTMWTAFCEQVVTESSGELVGKIEVATHHTSAEKLLQQMPTWKRYGSMIDQWRDTAPNFDINKTEQFTEANGWHVDKYATGLPSEAPGEPIPHGSFEAAKQILLNYEFPDPTLISGVFVPDVPLAERVMVLRAHFLLFTFFFGVHIGNVVDEIRQTEKQGPARVWGYSYRTLKGHFEMGEITFELWKYLQTGEIQFHIHAYSKPDRIANPFYRLGFRIFGRSLQIRFARTSMTRMQQLVLERLSPPDSQTKPVDKPEVQQMNVQQGAQQEGDKGQAAAVLTG